MRWGVEKRLEFIEFRLFWEGGINRVDITERFGLSVPQASKDLTLYEEKAPGNLIYDKSAKRYLASPSFRPTFFKPECDTYLNQIHTLRSRDVEEPDHDSWIGFLPQAETLPIPQRRIDPEVLRSLVAAIRETRSVEILYQSMNPMRPTPDWRRITPHAFGNDGLRWHARAFCHIDQKFKDFILSRCLDSRNLGEPAAEQDADTQWFDTFEVKLVPNPALSFDQRKFVAQDYLMVEQEKSIPVRKALLYYFQKRLRLDDTHFNDQPNEVPVIVANRVAFDAALKEAMQ